MFCIDYIGYPFITEILIGKRKQSKPTGKNVAKQFALKVLFFSNNFFISQLHTHTHSCLCQTFSQTCSIM